MTTLAEPISEPDLAAPASEAEIVPAHLAARQIERRLMLALSVLAFAMFATVAAAYRDVLIPPSDLVTFAFRV